MTMARTEALVSREMTGVLSFNLHRYVFSGPARADDHRCMNEHDDVENRFFPGVRRTAHIFSSSFFTGRPFECGARGERNNHTRRYRHRPSYSVATSVPFRPDQR